MIKNMMVRDLPELERPREKLIAHGVKVLSNVELLAVLLRSGTKQSSVLHVAENLLSLYREKGLASIVNLSVDQLSKIDGVGPAKAASVLAAIELGLRIAQEPAGNKISLTSPAAAAAYIMPQLRYATKEKFAVVLLNVKKQVLFFKVVFVGTLDASLVHPREVMSEALLHSAAAIILTHNHPSGDSTPSEGDILTTHRLCKAGKIMGIEIVDHIIIGDNEYMSFKEQNLLK